MFPIEKIRQDFPILHQKINGRPFIYFDNAATTQKPLEVLNASRRYYEEINANIHRGVHTLSQLATSAHEKAREHVAEFLHAREACEVLFTSGCTEGINLVSTVLGWSGRLDVGDEIIVSELEHHSNIVPWQMLCERTGAHLRVIPLKTNGGWDEDAYAQMLTPQTKVIALSHVSNALGTIHPVREFMKQAKDFDPNIITLIDGAQAVPHIPVNVQDLYCDFYAFSGHKIYAPTGIGILWGKKALLESLPPYRGGGEMIKEVTFAKTTYNVLPFKYEAGTPNIEGAIALDSALRFVESLGINNIAAYENELTDYCLRGLKEFPQIRILAEDLPRAGVISFVIDGVHSYDIGVLLDQMGIAVRTGHHCCQPLMNALNIDGTTRVSFAMYNTHKEIDDFLSALKRTLNMLS